VVTPSLLFSRLRKKTGTGTGTRTRTRTRNVVLLRNPAQGEEERRKENMYPVGREVGESNCKEKKSARQLTDISYSPSKLERWLEEKRRDFGVYERIGNPPPEGGGKAGLVTVNKTAKVWDSCAPGRAARLAHRRELGERERARERERETSCLQAEAHFGFSRTRQLRTCCCVAGGWIEAS
jgi:hypothetical protein